MNISASIRKLTILFITLFIALSGGLVYWQVMVASQLTANAHNGRRCQAENTPVRGKILDRNGVVLAESIPYSGPYACGGYIRHYTDPGLAGLIGYYVPGGIYPATGLEAVYNSYLNGTSGATALGNTINQTLHTQPVGNNIYLTIDERIQKIAEQDYNAYSPQTGVVHGNRVYQSNRGAAVITDPQTGELLAMVSTPSYDPNKMVEDLTNHSVAYYNQEKQDPDQPLIFRPTLATYIPGSVFKTVTLMAALDSGATTLGQNWNQDTALTPWNVDGITIRGDNLGYKEFLNRFPVDTEFGYANSDNIMFARIGRSVGENTWLDYARRMYLGQDVPTELVVAQSSVMQSDGTLSDAEFLNDAYGQGVDSVTPFQMSLIDNTVANNGVLMRPMIVDKITDKDGNPTQTYSPQELNTVVSKNTAYQVREAMNAVATCGSAWNVTADAQPQTTIIGKTGTAELGGGANPHGWMITQAPFFFNQPDKMPALTIVAMRQNGGEGAYSVGPAIWHMYMDIFNQKLVTTDLSPWLNPQSFCRPQNLWH
ncbi:penicillin-binding protein [Ktedonobacteria bacterium brp13]|nr:penicillin-binding protein [Ktedonobacteria bacterium brp13]